MFNILILCLLAIINYGHPTENTKLTGTSSGTFYEKNQLLLHGLVIGNEKADEYEASGSSLDKTIVR